MEPLVALYLDFENLAVSASTVYGVADKPLRLEPVLKYAEAKGKVRIKRAYADWSKRKFSQYQGQLISLGFELIHLPETNRQGKNGADMRLVIDVTEHLKDYPRIHTIIIGSGDSDFIPLTQHILTKDKEAVIIGFAHSVSPVLKTFCTEFRSLESLIGLQPAPPPEEKAEPASPLSLLQAHAALVVCIARYAQPWPAPLLAFQEELMRTAPNLSLTALGFTSFKKFLRHWQGDLIDRLEKKDGNWVVYPSVVAVKEKQPEALPADVAEPVRTAKIRPLTSKNGNRKPTQPNEKKSPDPDAWENARQLMKSVVCSLTDAIGLGQLKSKLLELDPEFSEKKIGFNSFRNFAASFTGELFERVEQSGREIRVYPMHLAVANSSSAHEPGEIPAYENGHNGRHSEGEIAELLKPGNSEMDEPRFDFPFEAPMPASSYLHETLGFNPVLADRLESATDLIEGFNRFGALSQEQMLRVLVRPHNSAESRLVYIRQLLDAGILQVSEPALSNIRLHRLNPEIQSPDALDDRYIQYIIQQLLAQYPELSQAALLDLLTETLTEADELPF